MKQHECPEREVVWAEELCREAVAASQDAMIGIDAGGTIILWNQAAERLLGYSSREMLGESLDSILPVSVRDMHREFVNGCLAQGKPHETVGRTMELDAVRRDGKVIPVALSLSGGAHLGQPFVVAAVRDVADQQLHDRLLRESQTRLKAILHTVLTGVILIDADTHEIVDLNPAAAEMIGLPAERIAGRTCQGFICPAPEGQCPVTDLGQTVSKRESVLLRADGSRLPIVKQVTDVWIEDHRYLVDSFVDISDQKRLLHEMRRQKDLVSEIIANIPAFVFWKDRECRYLGCNPVFARSAGVGEPSEMVGKTDFDLVWKNEAERYRADDRQVMESGEPILAKEEPQTLKDGSQITLLTSKVPLRDTDGSVVGVLGIYLDITARREMERALEQHWLFLSQVLDFFPGSVAVLDGSGRINMVNQTWWQFAQDNDLPTDYTFEGIDYLEICRQATGPGSEGAAEIAQEIAALLDGRGSSFQHEYPCHSPTTQRWFQIRASTFRHQASRWVVVAHIDVTERKLAELKQDALMKELESVNRELKDFAYIVSHDLKAPLRGIRTVAEWLVNDFSESLGSEGRKHLEVIRERASRMSALIGGILEYSRVGRKQERYDAINLNELLQQLAEDLSPPEHISISIEPALPVVKGEPTRIRQLFQNLLSNAIKYNDKECGQIRIECIDRHDCWEFSVADNGPGIPQEHFERIFQIFQTLSADTGSENTGVGLTVAKKIVERHGGRLWVTSDVGKGSTFSFTLSKATTEGAHGNDAAAAAVGR